MNSNTTPKSSTTNNNTNLLSKFPMFSQGPSDVTPSEGLNNKYFGACVGSSMVDANVNGISQMAIGKSPLVSALKSGVYNKIEPNESVS